MTNTDSPLDELKKNAQVRKFMAKYRYQYHQTMLNDLVTLIDSYCHKQVIEAVKSKDNAYWERNQLVSALSKLYPAWLGYHTDKDWDDDWRTIVYIKIPITKPTVYGDARNSLGPRYKTEHKQLSWHIHDDDKQYFTHLDPGLEEWDGHTTEEKYKRLAELRKTL